MKNTKGPFIKNNHTNRVSISDFALNKKLVLASQIMGCGNKENNIFTILLGIGKGITLNINQIQNKIHPVVKMYKKFDSWKYSIWKKIKFQMLFLNKYIISVCADTRWSTASGYASMNGTFVACGNNLGLVLVAHFMYNCCNKCTWDIFHSPVECSKNVEIHAKAYEADGAKDFVSIFFLKYDYFIQE